jgi:hypothetical protein
VAGEFRYRFESDVVAAEIHRERVTEARAFYVNKLKDATADQNQPILLDTVPS